MTGLYFKGSLVIDHMFALAQQGLVWSASRRELAIADAGSMDVLLDVASSFVGNIEIQAGGPATYDFLAVTSHTIGAVSILDAFNTNTFFQASQSGNFSIDFTHTASYEVTAARFQGVVEGGAKNFVPVGILGPGQYALQIQNKAGAASDIAVVFSFAEPEIPNVP